MYLYNPSKFLHNRYVCVKSATLTLPPCPSLFSMYNTLNLQHDIVTHNIHLAKGPSEESGTKKKESVHIVLVQQLKC